MSNSGVTPDAFGAAAACVACIALAIIVGDPTVGLVLGGAAFACAIFFASRVPIRVTLAVLMFMNFALENPVEGATGLVASPLAIVGSVMMQHLNNTTGIRPLFMSGNDVMLVSLLLISAFRRSSGGGVDRPGHVVTPRPLVRLAHLSWLGSAYTFIVGMLRGGNFSMSLWQLDRVMYLPLIFVVAHRGLRGVKDGALLAKAAFFGAVVKAGYAVWVTAVAPERRDWKGELQEIACPTDHSTSILFATASVILGAMLIERVGKRRWLWTFLLLPIFVTGMIYNHRRMVWVEIALVFVTLYFVTPPNKITRMIKKAAYVLVPVAAIYLRLGWYSQSSIFKPAQTVRTVVDPDYDPSGSSQTRKIENYNLTFTMKQFPIFGAGYGNGYWQIIPLPEMGYPMEPYCPHNSILGLWVFCGLIGYAATTMLWVGSLYFAFRALLHARDPPTRATALACYGGILAYVLQAWGDMGLGSWIGVYTAGPAMALSGKLAVSVGAWPTRQRAKAGAQSAPQPGPEPGPAVADAGAAAARGV
jgi:hypothetical protein